MRRMTFQERGRMLKRLALHLHAMKEEFYQVSWATGATRADSWIDIEGGIEISLPMPVFDASCPTHHSLSTASSFPLGEKAVWWPPPSGAQTRCGCTHQRVQLLYGGCWKKLL